MSFETTREPHVSEIVREGAQSLMVAGVESAWLDAEVLLGHALAMTREQLIVSRGVPLGGEPASQFNALLQRRLRREPLAYIIERKEFWSMEFVVTPDVLIPRPETELLIEIALGLVGQLHTGTPLRIVDVGTGSGAIAISLAKELPRARFWATDSSIPALALARRNAGLNGVADQITFLAGDLLAAFTVEGGGFDLIVSNPPYLRTGEIATLEPEVSQWEPRAALDGGADGMEFYRRIAAQAWQLLKPGSGLVTEVGAGMGREVLGIFSRAGCYRDAAVIQDYTGKDRVVMARNAAQPQRSK